MRTIKFRLWNNAGENSRMFYDTEQVMECLKQQTLFNDINNKYHKLGFDHAGSGSSFMQFIGLLDKNGKEIYEGDIVIPTKFKDVPNEVKYIQNGFYRVKIHNNADYVNPLGNCEVEVIGNIYEHPNLLK